MKWQHYTAGGGGVQAPKAPGVYTLRPFNIGEGLAYALAS
jgi:hypothetical protein